MKRGRSRREEEEEKQKNKMEDILTENRIQGYNKELEEERTSVSEKEKKI